MAPQARTAGVPVVAFSSDANVAGPGVYLLSFLPSDDVDRIVSYSASQGRKSFGALLAGRRLWRRGRGGLPPRRRRRRRAHRGDREICRDRRRHAGQGGGASPRIAPQIDALLCPTAAPSCRPSPRRWRPAASPATACKFLGSGQWDDPRILNDPALVGSWFPAPPKQGFEEFSRKYQAAYGAAPPRNATLAYDATVLAAGLVRRYGPEAFRHRRDRQPERLQRHGRRLPLHADRPDGAAARRLRGDRHGRPHRRAGGAELCGGELSLTGCPALYIPAHRDDSVNTAVSIA